MTLSPNTSPRGVRPRRALHPSFLVLSFDFDRPQRETRFFSPPLCVRPRVCVPLFTADSFSTGQKPRARCLYPPMIFARFSSAIDRSSSQIVANFDSDLSSTGKCNSFPPVPSSSLRGTTRLETLRPFIRTLNFAVRPR